MTNDVSSCKNCTGRLVQQLGGVWNNMDVVAVTKCWYQWIHFCGVLVQRSSSTLTKPIPLLGLDSAT